MKYRKKPIVIEAVRWMGDNYEEIILFTNNASFYPMDSRKININTLEGNMKADIGDYIVKGIKGEVYPVKPDIFEKTYEEAKNEEKAT